MPRRSADTPAPVSSPGAAEWIGATLVIVVACALAGYLGSLAAASPGDPSFVWPPAGIGLAAVLRLGRRALPGVLLGGIAATAQGVLGPEAVESAGLHGAAIVGIGVGAMLQALVAASLLKRFDLAGKPLLGFKDISLSFVLICAACLVGATIGTLALSAAGLVPLDAAARTWSTWWVGELAGILLFAPLALALARKDVVTGGLLLAVLSAGMGATYVASKQIRAAADDAWQRSVNSETNQLTATVLQRIESSMAPVYSVGVLFKSSSSVFDSEDRKSVV